MEQFYLEEPSIKQKEKAIDYINEFKKYSSDINGDGSLDKYLQEKTYEEWVEYTANKQKKQYAHSHKKVPSTTYFLIRSTDDKIIGMLTIKHELTEDLKRSAGHIEYSIRPTERRKGYAKINLYLGLLECKKYNLDNIQLVHNFDNQASEKVIKALGGILTKTILDPFNKLFVDVYWLDVKKSISKYQNNYKKYLLNTPK